MKYHIGTSMKYLREKRNIPQSGIYEGLCSQAKFSRIERGEKEMDQLLFYAFLTRLGISTNKYTLILSQKDIALMEQRKEIEAGLQSHKLEEAKGKLEQYSQNDFIGTTKKLHEQYVNFIKAQLHDREGKLEKAKEQLEIGIGRTKKSLLNVIKGTARKEIQYISEMELMQVCLYSTILEKEEEKRVGEIWNWMYQYIEKNIEDMEYKMRFYPLCSYSLASFYQKEGNWMECLSYCNKAIEHLKQYRSGMLLKEFLELYQLASKEMGIEPKRENVDYLSVLNFIEDNLLDNHTIEKRTHLGVYGIGDVIKHTREYAGLTQEQLNDIQQNGKGKADPSTVSYIENGHRNPRKTTSDYCFQKLGLGQYQKEIAPLVGEDFELQELRWKLDYMLHKFQFDTVEELCKQIEEKVDISIAQNQQYIERVKAILAYHYYKKINLEKYRECLIQILRKTWSDYDIEDMRPITRFLTKTEKALFINIAQSYKDEEEYEVAIQLYRKLKEYFEKVYPNSEYTSYMLLCYSLDQALGLSGEHEESIMLSKKGIQLGYIKNNLQLLYRHLYGIGWNYGELLLKSSNEEEKIEYKKACQLYLEQALKGAVFINNIEIINAIKEQVDLLDIKIEKFQNIR